MPLDCHKPEEGPTQGGGPARIVFPLLSAIFIAALAAAAYILLLQAGSVSRAGTLSPANIDHLVTSRSSGFPQQHTELQGTAHGSRDFFETDKIAYMRPESQVLPEKSNKPAAERVVMLFEEPGNSAPKVAVQPLVTRSAPSDAATIAPPRVAIIIDDMGYRQEICNGFLEMDLPLSFSFLPHAPHTLEMARRAREKGRDILMHLPLEPKDHSWDPGPGALYLDSYTRVLDKVLAWNLEAVPGAIGVNNHMGSLFTADPRAMEFLMARLAPTGLFFVDSVTIGASRAFTAAQKKGIPAARRNVFLDHSLNRNNIKAQVDTLIKLARSQGSAIAIAHPHQQTLDIIRLVKDRLQKEVVLTPIHTLVSR